MKTEHDILRVIKKDKWMMQILQTVWALHLPDWWIGAGFVRNKIFDVLHRYTKRTPLNDIDIIYFDQLHTEEKYERALQQKLRAIDKTVRWSVKNQARMHSLHHDPPYHSATEGLSRWNETATCIGIKLLGNNKLVLVAPHGIYDLTHLLIRQNPGTSDAEYKNRLRKKQWKQRWPKLTTIEN